MFPEAENTIKSAGRVFHSSHRSGSISFHFTSIIFFSLQRSFVCFLCQFSEPFVLCAPLFRTVQPQSSPVFPKRSYSVSLAFETGSLIKPGVHQSRWTGLWGDVPVSVCPAPSLQVPRCHTSLVSGCWDLHSGPLSTGSPSPSGLVPGPQVLLTT